MKKQILLLPAAIVFCFVSLGCTPKAPQNAATERSSAAAETTETASDSNVTSSAMTPGGNVTSGAMTPGGNVTSGSDTP